MRWYIPSWNGDFRLEARAREDGPGCVLTVTDPTPAEQEILARFSRHAHKKGWLLSPYKPEDIKPMSIIMGGELGKVAAALTRMCKPKDRTLSVVSFKDGRLETATSAEASALERLAEKTELPEAKVAASVSRPTPSCPQCEPGAILPASEVLLSFLSAAEHEDWARHRAIVVTGGLSGHRYVLAHRHSPMAQRFGRVCFDLDDRGVVHFFDWSVPPEEEILGAKLILEHQEPWLRNEATCLYGNFHDVYKNPFGGIGDGTETSSLLWGVGNALRTLLS